MFIKGGGGLASKIFLSWSGELSRKLAEALRGWLPSVLQYVKPYFTPEDIEKGAKWGPEISKELESSNIGIVCLTRDNTEKPWILFEAGALSKSIQKSHVCTLLFDLEPADVKGPLTSFQGTRFARDDFKKLVVTINSAAGDQSLDSSVLDGVFDMWWPKLEQQVSEIIASHNESGSRTKRRSERDILEELLELTRMTASRPVRSVRVSPRAISELVDSIDELMMMISSKVGPDAALHFYRRIDRPLNILCSDAGIPDVYERLRIWNPKLRPRVVSMPEPEPAIEGGTVEGG